MNNNYDEDLDLELEEDKIKVAISKRETATEKKIMKRLSSIVRKSPSLLTLDDKKFLKARASYLTKADRVEYADIIEADYSKVTDDEGANITGESEEVLNEKMSRGELEAKALALGLENLEQYPNKKSLIDAINQAK